MSYLNNFILLDGRVVDIENIKDNLIKIVLFSEVFNPSSESVEEETHEVFCENGVANYITKFVEDNDNLTIKGVLTIINDEEVIKAEKVYKNTLNIVKMHGYVGKKETKKNNVTILNIATNDFYLKKGSDEKIKETDWHRIVCFGKVSDIVKDSIIEGDLISVLGKLKTNIFENKKYVEIHAEKVRIKKRKLKNGEDDEKK